MVDSILSSTKVSLGVPEEQIAFDSEILMFINTALSTLTQLGVGPEEGFSITDVTATWDDLIAGDARYNMVQTYTHLAVRLLFDPPSTGHALSATQKLKEELEWRINRAREDIVAPLPDAQPDIRDDLWADYVSIDGGDLDA